jgi:hypothetical protein
MRSAISSVSSFRSPRNRDSPFDLVTSGDCNLGKSCENLEREKKASLTMGSLIPLLLWSQG